MDWASDIFTKQQINSEGCKQDSEAQKKGRIQKYTKTYLIKNFNPTTLLKTQLWPKIYTSSLSLLSFSSKLKVYDAG